MDRLTKIDGIGANDCIKCFDCNIEKAGPELENCGYCEHFNRVLDRLAAYENTGLMPEEVEALKLCQMGKAVAEIKELNGITIERLREIGKAEQEGRIRILPKSEIGTCGSCGHFHRTHGKRSGTCDVKLHYTNRYGAVDKNRGRFTPAQSQKCCKQYIPKGDQNEIV